MPIQSRWTARASIADVSNHDPKLMPAIQQLFVVEANKIRTLPEARSFECQRAAHLAYRDGSILMTTAL